MMMAKAIAVQLVSMLGYHILFQDVDMIWYQHPLDYFYPYLDDYRDVYDIFFQDDGGRSVRYAPYSANSGFYFIRYNARTRHLLTSVLMAGDRIVRSRSHQQVLIALLNEHVTLYGLKVKVMSRDKEEFPGGYHYHQRSKEYMKDLFVGNVNPLIFHMSWTSNKVNKILFFRQMGEWYVPENCIQRKVGEITKNNVDSLATGCCVDEPIFSCHFRDKPSIHPCYSSPPLDKEQPSWW
jgi:Nucleotide-diphospho-sugar transferase